MCATGIQWDAVDDLAGQLDKARLFLEIDWLDDADEEDEGLSPRSTHLRCAPQVGIRCFPDADGAVAKLSK